MQQDHQMCSGRVTQAVVMQCVDATGEASALASELGYCPDDPFAVTATFRTPGGDVVWTFARDLLSRGLTDPAGEGDVHVWPCLDLAGRAVVIIELRSPDGELVLQAPTEDVSRFVNKSLALVPAGLEGERVDLDQLIDQLLGAA